MSANSFRGMQLGTEQHLEVGAELDLGLLVGVTMPFGFVATEVDAEMTGSGHSKTTRSVGSLSVQM